MEPVWRLIETYHAVVYYAEERKGEYDALGLKGGWMGYFASRSAALGPVAPAVVTACFYNFAPRMVQRALPDAWRYTTPAAAAEARVGVVDQAMRRLLGAACEGDDVRRAADLAVQAASAAALPARPLFAAHRALPVPDAPHLRLFWATSALREYRGDGHNAVLLQAGVDGCEANVLLASLGRVPAAQRTFRGWTEQEWQQAVVRLQERGWLDESGAVTNRGADARAEIETATEALAAPALGALGTAATNVLASSLARLAEPIVAAGAVPYPNGMGVPPVAGLAATR